MSTFLEILMLSATITVAAPNMTLKQLSDAILMREKLLADCRGKKAVDSEIVPFEHVADHARDDHLTHLGKIQICLP